MRFDLIDRFGRETSVWVNNNWEPVLEDAEGRPVIDYQGLFPMKRANPKRNDPIVKGVIDAFLQRPSAGVSDFFLEKPEWYEKEFPKWRDVMMVMTGKLLVKVSK